LTKLIPVSEALNQLLEAFSTSGVEKIPLRKAAGRVLAEPVRARVDLPPFSNSSMDGFAVRIADVSRASPSSPTVLAVIEDIPAGKTPAATLQAGQAARIMTGAPIPDGAEAVVPVEDTDFNQRDPGTPAPESVTIYKAARPGDNIRPAGQDLRSGEEALAPGQRLRPQDVGFLAMLGVAEAPVYRQPRVALFSTGDELVPPQQPLEPGKIHDSNSYTLAGLVARSGGVPIELGIAPDRAEAVQALFDQAAAGQADLILSTAGVSVGAFDYVRDVLERRGKLTFWRVNMRPGKPLAFGSYQDIPFIGLPGNPVSAFVGFEVFVRPALHKMAGLPRTPRPAYTVRLSEPLESDGRESYLRSVIHYKNGQWHARLAGHQGSGNLRSLVLANALLIVPSGVKSLAVGDEVQAWFLDEPLPGALPG
jgi:molybdopterin molybdotransferase